MIHLYKIIIGSFSDRPFNCLRLIAWYDIPLICFSEISAEYMGARTQNMPPQAPVTILPMTKSGTNEPAQMSKAQPPMKAGIKAIIVHFRPILSISRGTTSVPRAAPTGNTDAITSVEKSSKLYLSLFNISTHGALQPRPHPSENPPMQAEQEILLIANIGQFVHIFFPLNIFIIIFSSFPYFFLAECVYYDGGVWYILDIFTDLPCFFQLLVAVIVVATTRLRVVAVINPLTLNIVLDAPSVAISRVYVMSRECRGRAFGRLSRRIYHAQLPWNRLSYAKGETCSSGDVLTTPPSKHTDRIPSILCCHSYLES